MKVGIAKFGLRCHRRVLWSLLIGLVAGLFFLPLLIVFFAEESTDKRLIVGSTTFDLEFDRDTTQPAALSHQRWNPSWGTMSSGRRVSLRLPHGTLSFGYEYDPVESIRARLPADVPSLTRLLDTSNPFQIYCVAGKLSETPSNALPALPKLITAAERQFHIGESIELISRAAQRDAVPCLMSGVSSTNLDLRAYCANILGDLGTNAVAAAPAILQTLRASTNGWPGRAALVRAHFTITGDLAPTLPIIRHDLTNSSELNEKWGMLFVLRDAGSQGSPAMPEVLCVANDTNSARVRFMALRAYARIGGDQSIVLPVLLSALTNSNRALSSSCSSAIVALGDLGPTGIPHLIRLYQGTNEQNKMDAAETLARIGPPAIAAQEEITNELRTGNPDNVALACNIITNLGPHTQLLLPALTNVLHTPNLRSRLHAAVTLKKIGYHSDTLVRILTDLLVETRGDPSLAFQTLHSIIQTNAAAKAVFQQRLTVNRRAAQSYEKQLLAWRFLSVRYGLRSPDS